MKRHIILIISFLSSTITLCAQESNKNYILAMSVDLYLNTPARVTCDRFATAFNSRLTVNAVSQSDSIASFMHYIQNIKYAKQDRGIDVRCKFVYEAGDKQTITICTDGDNILLNERLIKRNKKFINFLNSIVHRYP